MSTVELATAYYNLVPSMGGAERSITSQLVPAASGAGTSAGVAGGAAMGASMRSRFMRVLGPAAIAAGVVAGFKGLYSIGDQFRDLENTIRVSSGASGEALEGLVDSARSVGTAIPTEFSTAGEALATLNTLTGATDEALEGMTVSVLEASRMLGEDGTANAERFGSALRQWQRPAEDAPDILDAMFVATQDYGIGLDTLTGYLRNHSSTLQNAGFSMEEAAGLFAQLEAGGIQVTRIMPGLNSAFRGWASEGKNSREEMARVVEAMQNAETQSEALAIATDEFGAEGAQRLTTAVRNGIVDFDDLTSAMEGSQGAIASTAEETMTFSERWQMLGNTAQDALEPLATTVFDSLGNALEFAMPYFESLAGWLSENEWALGVIVGIIGVGLVGAFMALVAPVWAVTAALLANPITWIVLGVTALIAGLIALVKNWDTVVEFLQGAWAGVVDWVTDLWDSLTETVSEVWNTITDTISDSMSAVWDVITGVWDSVTGAVGTAIDTVRSVVSAAWQWIQSATSTAWDAVRTAVMTPINAVRNLVSTVVTTVRNSISSAWNTVRSVTTTAFNGVRTAVANAITNVISTVRGLPGRALSALGNIGSTLLSAGRDLIQGFINGIRNMAGRVISAITGTITNALPNFVKNALGISSPSKVFMALAEDTMDGFALGISRGGRDVHGEMDEVMAELTAPRPGVRIPVGVTGAARADLAPPGGAAAGSGQRLDFTINEAQDPMSVARTTARVLAMAGG